MWAAKIYIADAPCETLPTLTADGIEYYPKQYNAKDQQLQLATADGRSSSSPSPKRPRTDAAASTDP